VDHTFSYSVCLRNIASITRSSDVKTHAEIRLNYLTVKTSNRSNCINFQEPSFTPNVSNVITRIPYINLYILSLSKSKDCLNGRRLPGRTRIGSDLCRNARKPYFMLTVSPAILPRPSRQVYGSSRADGMARHSISSLWTEIYRNRRYMDIGIKFCDF
jgi:hypothetical protein